MTRRHYIALAAALAATRPTFRGRAAYDVWVATVRAIGDALAADNGRFDRGRFEYAAGIRS